MDHRRELPDARKKEFRRRFGIDKHPNAPSREECLEAIHLGLSDDNREQRDQKDLVNIVDRWVQANGSQLAQATRDELTARFKAVHNARQFGKYRRFVGLSTAFRATAQAFLEYARDNIPSLAALIAEGSNLALQTAGMPVMERRERNQQWLDRIPPEYRDDEAIVSLNRQEIIAEGFNLELQTAEMPVMERRERNQQWLDRVPPEYRDNAAIILLNSERLSLIESTAEVSVMERRERNQQWLDRVPPEYRDDEAHELIHLELIELRESTAEMPVMEMRERNQQWLDHVPPEYIERDNMAVALIRSERTLIIDQAEGNLDYKKSKIYQDWLKLVPQEYREALWLH